MYVYMYVIIDGNSFNIILYYIIFLNFIFSSLEVPLMTN
jgi:hypothetical protein